MTSFLKSLYRKLFGIKTGAYDYMDEIYIPIGYESNGEYRERHNRKAYDPSTDENKIMNGEVESYFE